MQKSSPEQVRQYYNEMTKSYLDIYGDVIQAFRPADTEKLLDYVGRSAGINWGLKVLDMGCGVAGPAIHFVKRWNVTVDGVTISEVQYREGNIKIQQAGVENKIKLYLGDYHKLDIPQIKDNDYDVVVFLESLGHSDNIAAAVRQAYAKLKTGGVLYIKDFYRKHVDDADLQQKIDKIIDNINKGYAYNTLDLGEVETALTQTGFRIVTKQYFDFIDDITVRFEFEKANNLDIFEGHAINPADWLEIKCVKE